MRSARGEMLQSWKELGEIYKTVPMGRSRWDLAEDMKQFEKDRAQRQAKTRKNCAKCDCVLYVRSVNDMEEGENDLDEVFPVRPGCYGVHCFQCHTNRPNVRRWKDPSSEIESYVEFNIKWARLRSMFELSSTMNTNMK